MNAYRTLRALAVLVLALATSDPCGGPGFRCEICGRPFTAEVIRDAHKSQKHGHGPGRAW